MMVQYSVQGSGKYDWCSVFMELMGEPSGFWELAKKKACKIVSL